MKLNESIAVVTGVSSGLGKALAKALIDEGAKVYGIARTVAALNKLEEQLGDDFIAVPLDITNQKGVEIWMDETFGGQTSPDILINNAGAGYFDKIDKLPDEKWHQMINTNLNGVFYLTRKIVPLMKQSSK